MRRESEKNKVIGCLVGLAVGDALGTSVEFKERDTFEPVTDMRGGGVFQLNPGEWTDDTSMALALADSILEKGTVDKVDLIQKFVKWYREGAYSHNGRCFDIGGTTRRSLMYYHMKGIYEDAPDDFIQSGNGSIMRLAPIPIRWYDDYDTAFQMAWDQSITTHGSTTVKETINKMMSIILNFIHQLEPRINFRDYKNRDRNDIKSTGYCVDTLDAALWAIANTDNFNDAVLLAVNLGDDADTVGAVTGQIAGALYGFSGIRKDWIEKLAWSDKIIDTAEKLFEAGKRK